MGRNAPLAKLRKSRHFQTESRVKSTDRPIKLPGPEPLLCSIPLGLSRPTLLRSGSPFFPSLPQFESRYSLRVASVMRHIGIVHVFKDMLMLRSTSRGKGRWGSPQVL